MMRDEFAATCTATAPGLLTGPAPAAPRAEQDSEYQALNPRGRRRSTTRRVRPEDLILTQSRRDLMGANSLDVWRNFSLLAWAIRRTLDYCCLWDFQPATENDDVDRQLRTLMARDTQAEQIDFVGRMEWDDMRRVAQAQQILTGDFFFVKLAEGTLQGIEGSYCRSPQQLDNGTRWVNGARLNGRGRVTAWNFREQPLTEAGRTPRDRSVAAANVWQHTQYDARANQLRPASMLAQVLNDFRDLDETFDHARAKVKLDQLFGIAFTRDDDDDDELGDTVDEGGDAVDEGEAAASNVRNVDFGKGPAVFDLDPGEGVETITANNPGNNTQAFLQLCVMVALKGLDLPYSFLDESHSTFHGQRGGWIQYQRACHARRQTQLRLHRKMTVWRLWRWVLPPALGGTGELVLPRSMRVEDVRFRWVSRGMPWWKPAEELQAALAEAAAGLRTMQGICDEWGLGDYRENIKQLAREQDEIREHGYVLEFNPQKLFAALRPIEPVTSATRATGGAA